MVSTEDLFVELEGVIRQLTNALQQSRNEVIELKRELNELKSQLDDTQKNLKVLEHKNKEIKVVSGLSGNAEHKRLMKLKLNSLIKEVDLCIAEIKKQSL